MTPGAGIPSVLHAVRTPAVRGALILGISGAFALQALLLIYFLAVEGVPKYDEYNFVSIATTYVEGGAFWDTAGFKKYGGSMMIFPHLIMLADVELFSWSFVFQMYVGWGFLAASVVLLWSMFRRHDRRLEWLLIPVSAVVFSPLGYGLLLWGHAASLWALTFLGFIACICCLDRVSESRRYLIPAVISGGVISFTSLPGNAVWPIGLVGLLQFGTMGRMPAVIWIASASVVLALFAILFPLWESRLISEILGRASDPGAGSGSHTIQAAEASGESQIPELAVSAGSYVMQFISNNATINHDAIQTALGAAMLVTVLVLPIPYLYSGRIRLRGVMPLVQLLLVSLAFGTMTFIGRPGNNPDITWYMIRGNFASIAFLSVLAVFLIAFLRTRPGRRRILYVMAPTAALLVVFAAGVGASYHAGYHAAAVYSNHQQMDMHCIMDPNNIRADTFLCLDVYGRPYSWMYDKPLEEHMAVMKDARIGPYRGDYQAPDRTLLRHENWQSMRDGLDVPGTIDNVFMYAAMDAVGRIDSMDLDGGILPSHHPKLLPDTGGATDADAPGRGGHSGDADAYHIKKSDFDDITGPALVVYGWIRSDESFSPDGVYLFVGDEIIRRAIYGYVFYDGTDELSDGYRYGYRVLTDISDLGAGCHDITIRAVQGDRYGQMSANMFCIDAA